MKKIGLVVDEGADLPEEIIKRCQIKVVHFKMDWPEIEKLPGENTFQKMREARKRNIKSFGKTSQPSPKNFLDAFREQLERFERVLCITITSKLSGTYNSAIQAKNFLTSDKKDKIFILDSLNGSCGEGLLVLRAVDLIEEGKQIEEIVKELEKVVPKIFLRAMLEDVKWLEASGRISSVSASLLRKMQKIGIRPMIGARKGVIVPIGIKGRVKDIPTALFGELEAKIKQAKRVSKGVKVAITHGDTPIAAQKLKEMIEKRFPGVEVAFVSLIDNVLGVLVGPNALALAWMVIE